MSQAIALLGELETALKGADSEKRVATLRQVMDLFLGEAERLNEHQIGVFDDLLMHLVEKVQTKALVQLSTGLANVANAPMQVAQSLARNAEISIAGPILTNSIRLTDSDLIEIAQTNGQGHLTAISGRTTLTEAVLLGFARANKVEQMTTTLALFCGTSAKVIEQLMKTASHDGLVIACRAAKLNWPTFVAILKARFVHHTVSEYELETARDSFLALSQASAHRTIRFMSVQQATKAG